MAVIQTPDYFGNAFAQSFAQSRHYAQQEAERKRQEEAWKQYSSTFVPSQPMDVQQVQAPVSALPGQSGLGTQPSAPIQQPIQTQTEQVNMPSKDTYKQLEYQTGKEFAAKLQAMSQLQPQERQMAMRQLWQEREATLANARYDRFNTEISELMSGYNPQDRMSEVQTKAKAISLARKYKIDPQDALKLFEKDKQTLQFSPDGTAFINGQQVSEPGKYGKPDKPEKQPAGTWILQSNPDGSQTRVNTITGQTIPVKPASEILIPTPFGPMKNTDLLAKIEALRPKEVITTDDFGNKITKKDGNVELYNQLTGALKDWQNKQNPANSNQSTAAQSDLQMPLILEGISAIGEDAMRKKIAAKYGDKVAEEWIVRSRNWSR